MTDLREQLGGCLRGRGCLVGLANVIVAGTVPERYLDMLAGQGFDHVLFLDALDFGGAPGSAVLLNSGEMHSRFPQVSTHKLSLGLLSHWLEANGTTRAWLLGVQPESLRGGRPLSARIKVTLEILSQLLCGLVAEQQRNEPPRTRTGAEMNP